MQSAHAVESKSKAIQNAISKAQISAQTFQLKQKGTVVNNARSLSQDLVQLGVPVTKVNDAIHRVSRTVGVTVLEILATKLSVRLFWRVELHQKFKLLMNYATPVVSNNFQIYIVPHPIKFLLKNI